MKNIYDILVNFKKIPYEFYEWDKNDDIFHIKKIYSFKVENNVLFDLMNYEVVVSKDFLDVIYEKTEYYYGKQIKKINYSCIIYSDEIALALLFDETGKIIGKSKLLFDEEQDVILNGKDVDNYDIKYNIVKKNNYNFKFTRKESKIIFLLLKYLDKVFDDKSEDELKYLYYECYNKKENNFKKCYLTLRQDILKANFDVINNFKTLVKVLKK